MTAVKSFDPIIGTDPKIMILGSMPGIASLQAQQYYAHPRNVFWPIMAELFGIEWAADYYQRVSQLQKMPVVLWDVLKSCQRQGSLDTAIRSAGLETNPIEDLLARHRSIRLVAFNGAAAEQHFNRRVRDRLVENQALTFLRLPSTSPANAGISPHEKLVRWRAILSAVNQVD